METVFSRDGTRIAYDIYGSGTPLIFVTGAICSRKFMPVVADAKAFGSNFTVYNYDRRGRGESGDNASYSVDREVDDIEALIDAAGGQAQVYGHSSGAVLALEAAIRLPNKISRVVLYDASYVDSETGRTEYGKLIQKVHGFLDSAQNAKALRCFLIGIGMPKVFVYMLPLMPGWKTMKALAPTLRYDMALTRDLPPLDRIAGISIPTKIIYGQKSPQSIRVVAKKLADTIKTGRLIELEGQDHMVSGKALLPLLIH